ncbi:hypothetical protein AB1Y20_017910 [Prymnesium parvum]|uniref:Uncharacterized protein n=1 Tax=Prymnesium parvum TaxID=97485 RepID=A0AB34JL62_PRYPA
MGGGASKKAKAKAKAEAEARAEAEAARAREAEAEARARGGAPASLDDARKGLETRQTERRRPAAEAKAAHARVEEARQAVERLASAAREAAARAAVEDRVLQREEEAVGGEGEMLRRRAESEEQKAVHARRSAAERERELHEATRELEARVPQSRGRGGSGARRGGREAACRRSTVRLRPQEELLQAKAEVEAARGVDDVWFVSAMEKLRTASSQALACREEEARLRARLPDLSRLKSAVEAAKAEAPAALEAVDILTERFARVSAEKDAVQLRREALLAEREHSRRREEAEQAKAEALVAETEKSLAQIDEAGDCDPNRDDVSCEIHTGHMGDIQEID